MATDFKSGASQGVSSADFKARVARLGDPMANYVKPTNGRRSSARKQARPEEEEREREEAAPAKDTDAENEAEGPED